MQSKSLHSFLIRLFFQMARGRVSKGWTLIEVAVVTVIVGILAAMAFPSLDGIRARNELKSMTNNVQTALQQAQKTAIRRGNSCTVTFDAPDGITADAGCLQNAVNFPNGITFELDDDTEDEIEFSYRGNTVVEQTIILRSTGTVDVRCVVISEGLGLIRSGRYEGNSCVAGI